MTNVLHIRCTISIAIDLNHDINLNIMRVKDYFHMNDGSKNVSLLYEYGNIENIKQVKKIDEKSAFIRLI